MLPGGGALSRPFPRRLVEGGIPAAARTGASTPATYRTPRSECWSEGRAPSVRAPPRIPDAGRWWSMARRSASSAIPACRVSGIARPTVSRVASIGPCPMANGKRGYACRSARRGRASLRPSRNIADAIPWRAAGRDVGHIGEPDRVRAWRESRPPDALLMRRAHDVEDDPVRAPRGSGNGLADRFPEGRIGVAAVRGPHAAGRRSQAAKARQARETSDRRSAGGCGRYCEARRVGGARRRRRSRHGRSGSRSRGCDPVEPRRLSGRGRQARQPLADTPVTRQIVLAG